MVGWWDGGTLFLCDRKRHLRCTPANRAPLSPSSNASTNKSSPTFYFTIAQDEPYFKGNTSLTDTFAVPACGPRRWVGWRYKTLTGPGSLDHPPMILDIPWPMQRPLKM